MRLGTLRKKFVSTLGVIVLATAATAIPAQEARVGNLDGHAAAGKKEYRRYCIGCHGQDGDGMGENAQWIEPKPRDFTEAVFKCRSTPTGTLPTDDDLGNSIHRGFVNTNMPSWLPLTGQVRADLVAYIKSFSPRWSQGHGTPIAIPLETPATVESMLRGRALFQKMECWKCHGPAGHGDGPAAAALTDSKENSIRPYNFSHGTRFKCGETNQDLYRVFMTGLDGTPMPSFVDNLKPVEAWDLVHFLRTLQPPQTPEGIAWNTWLKSHSNTLTPIGPPTQ